MTGHPSRSNEAHACSSGGSGVIAPSSPVLHGTGVRSSLESIADGQRHGTSKDRSYPSIKQTPRRKRASHNMHRSNHFRTMAEGHGAWATPESVAIPSSSECSDVNSPWSSDLLTAGHLIPASLHHLVARVRDAPSAAIAKRSTLTDPHPVAVLYVALAEQQPRS
jgi:hypothetical protein